MRSKIQIPIHKSMITPSVFFVEKWAEESDLSDKDSRHLRETLERVLGLVVSRNSESNGGELEIQFDRQKDHVRIDVKNSGLPLFLSDFSDLKNGERIEEARKRSGYRYLDFANYGRLGQKVSFGLDTDVVPDLSTSEIASSAAEDIQIRPLRAGEETDLSRLFYSVYRYRYINEYVYYPEKIRQMIEEGKLVSVVGEIDGKICGHVGLLRLSESPIVYEAALGVVDPSYKSNGLFGKVFAAVHEIKARLPHDYCVYDFVTNHEFSQKLVARYGYHDLALCLGSQISETQAKLSELGIGSDAADMTRYSLLIAVASNVPSPFGKEIVLPAQIGEATEFLLKPLGTSWTPAARFSPMAKEGQFELRLQSEQKAVFVDFHQPGWNALEPMMTRLKDLLRNGYQYIAIDFPLNFSGLGQFYDKMAEEGFFMSGYIPYRNGGQLAFRFQFLAPTQVSFDNIRMHSKIGKKLMQMIKADYERNTIL